MDKSQLIRRIYGLDPHRVRREEPLRRSLIGSVLLGSSIILTLQAGLLQSEGIHWKDFAWTTIEPGLLLLLAWWCNRRGQVIIASTLLLVALSHAAAFTHAHYGLRHPAGSWLAATIVVCGLLVGAYFVHTWALICSMIVFWLSARSAQHDWPAALSWFAIYAVTAWLVALFSRHLERLIELNRSAEERERSVIVAERTRFAREVHDTLAQGFTGVITQLNAAELHLCPASDAARPHLEKARQLARESLDEARRSAHALRPGHLTGKTLVEALVSAGREIVPDGAITLATVIEGDMRSLPEVAEAELFRIGQEAFINAVRHANPTRIEVCLRYKPAAVELEVRDNGTGIQDGRCGRGLGIRNMTERAAKLGGEFRLRSTPGEGTTVYVLVPDHA
jgi:signal transduction histidine kinase